ncbi:MAG: hypothetical protein V2B14_06250 [bacterium]
MTVFLKFEKDTENKITHNPIPIKDILELLKAYLKDDNKGLAEIVRRNLDVKA